MARERNDYVSASEIAAWAWCPESWRLDSLGEEPDNLEAIARGAALHAEKSAFEVHSTRTASIGIWLLVVAFIAAALWCTIFGGAG